MSGHRDLELGIPEESENGEGEQPLLPQGSLEDMGPKLYLPSRPSNLSLAELKNHPRFHHLSNLDMDSISSAPSTVTNTPVAEHPEGQPRRWRRSDRRLRRYNTELLTAIEEHQVEEVERLLKAGANPNATCRLDYVSACHLAAMHGGDSLALLVRFGVEKHRVDKKGRTPLHLAAWAGNARQMAILLDFPEGKSLLSLLVKFGVEKHRVDKRGRTPLHLAAWAGNARQMAILLDFPEEIQNLVDNDSMSSEAEENVKKLCEKTKQLANMQCGDEVKTLLPNHWKDNIDHDCKYILTLPVRQVGWTPLHVASACARKQCTRLLLAAGADPNICDEEGRTALDVAGVGFYCNMAVDANQFTEVIRLLIKAGSTQTTMNLPDLKKVPPPTPLHIAVELESIEAIRELLQIGASIACLNILGETPLHLCVKKEFEEPLKVLANEGRNDAEPLAAIVDVKDRDGHTVLQAAIEAAWVAGVCIALESGADVTMKANDGETPVHSAAAIGNLDILNEILPFAKQKEAIDYQNELGETALFKAIKNGHIDCVRAILDEGASIKIMLKGNVSVFHVAAEQGYRDILEYLLDFNKEFTASMLNSLTDLDHTGFAPLHYAVMGNHLECVQLLVSRDADMRLRTANSPRHHAASLCRASTPLHIASVYNHADIARFLLGCDSTLIHEVNFSGWFPLHAACNYSSRDVITILLREGANLSGYTDGPKKYKRSAIDMLVNNLSKPTEFLEEVCDSYITTNDLNLQDTNCEVKIDYRILMPGDCELEQMKVVEALLKTGNRYGQKKLLVHPLVESFLHLKWKALLPFFYTIIALYGFFVMSLTIFAISVFFYKDTSEVKPIWLDSRAWGYVVYTSIFLIILQELLYMNVKSSRYFLQLETWVKFGSIGLAIILPPAVILDLGDVEWPRHVATVALLLAWIQMMFLLSRFPNWGYYVLMFGKVASNVVKILLTFAFLVIGFSLSFMIQFRSQAPFEGPISALLKTIVMMTSEFEYASLFDEAHSKKLAFSFQIVRLIFVVFLVLAAIVLMNLMVGVAVNDINDLELLGNIRRLDKQVGFLSTLDTLVYNKVFTKILPRKVNHKMRMKRNVCRVVTLRPGKPRWRHFKMLPTRIRDAIFTKAQSQKKQQEEVQEFEDFKTLMKELREMVTAIKEKGEKVEAVKRLEDKPGRHRLRHEEVMKRLGQLDGEVTTMREHVKTLADNSSSPVDVLNVKVDQISLEMEHVKQFLMRLESKLGYCACNDELRIQ